MIFTETVLAGAYIIDPERMHDERGSFARTFSVEEFSARGLNPRIAQCSVSHNRAKGTVRGMHFQDTPHREAKLVSCVRGAIHDCIVDIRPGSPTYRRWFAVELGQENGRALYIPEGFAHGFQTLADDTVVSYQISEGYHPESARGIRWDDPGLDLRWPLPIAVISERDRAYPDFAW